MLEDLFQSDEACIVMAMSVWANISFAPALLRNFRSFRGVLSAAPKGTPEGGKSLQATIARALAGLPEISPDVCAMLLLRMR
eukprot:9052046-Pyramimonas_sp.AAC.1